MLGDKHEGLQKLQIYVHRDLMLDELAKSELAAFAADLVPVYPAICGGISIFNLPKKWSPSPAHAPA